MKITEMNSGFLPDVEKIEAECFVHPWSRQSLEEYLNNPNAFFYVASEDDGRAVGYIGTYIVCDEAYVTNVAVSEQYRRQGIGKQLVLRATENAQRNNASFITLEVRVSNTAAVSLYKSLGFVLDGMRPGFYRDPDEDALIMTKRFQA